MRSRRVAAYFTRVYPARTGSLSRLLFRHGEGERIRILRAWLPDVQGLSVLDAGCGDGVCLAAALIGRPRELRLEDVSPTVLADAAARLAPVADTLIAARVDSFAEGSRRCDVVLGIGLLDYQNHLADSLRTLVARAARLVVVSIPRAGHPRNWLRWVWLALHGLPLRLITGGGATRLAMSLGYPCEVVCGPYEYWLRIDVGPRGTGPAGMPRGSGEVNA